MFDVRVILPHMGHDTGIFVGYCRSCDYDLRGIGEAGRCPECGRAFDLSDPRSIRRYPRRGIWRKLRWVAYPLLLIVLASSAGIGWLWWGWHREQPAIAWVRQHGAGHGTKSIGPPWIQQRMGRWAHLPQRTDWIAIINIDPGENAQQSPLWRLDRLVTIHMNGDGLTDDWMELIRQRLRPKTLGLYNHSLTPEGFASLGRLRSVEYLRTGSATTDDLLVHLKDMPNLKGLSLEWAEVRGPGLAYLSHLPKLECLQLENAYVDHSAVEQLAKLTKLKWLGLHKTKITPAEVTKLQQALPNCHIEFP